MYKRKLFYFGMFTSVLLIAVLVGTAISAHLTRANLKQSTVAQSLLIEHQKLSSISYRLFKQLTDELIFGQNANQADVRRKQVKIDESLANIRRLEILQREALGKEFTLGTVEDTDELAALIEAIITDFRAIVQNNSSVPIAQKKNLRTLLEETIDNQFREAINTAEVRQSRVVVAINAKIDALNTSIVWLTLGLGFLAIPLITYGCYWLFNQLYQPLVLIQHATDAIAAGEYKKPISEKLDDEFAALAGAINQLAKRLQEHERNEASSRQALEFEVKQRTHELTQANLQLTKVDARRRQFIADVSHELRTPLTIIRGEAQVTLRFKSAREEDYKETLEVILDQSVNLSHLVDDLLLLTRAEMNQLHLSLETVAIEAIVQAEVDKWKRLCTERPINFTPSKTDSNTLIRLDKQRIEQVISIIIDNANKYSAKGRPIEIGLHCCSTVVEISVSDEGAGISAAEIENIFERFVRFSKHNEGVGLGLPIAKAIIEAHSGNIRVESLQGEGSTFVISLPLEEDLA
ncbi:MAG: HAMP domain-containing sensor histidine kinase [Glaciecola sp.]